MEFIPMCLFRLAGFRGVTPVIVLRLRAGLCLDVLAGLTPLGGGAAVVFGRGGDFGVDGAPPRDLRVRSPKRLLYSSSLYTFIAASKSALS